MKAIVPDRILSELLRENKTPFYFYSKKALEQTIQEIKEAFQISNFQLLFATMANDNPEFIRTIASNNVGACINSAKHLNLVQECGIPSERIQFTSTGLTDDDMILLLKRGITVNFDSLNQLEKWFQLHQGGYAGIRINTGSLTDKAPVADRLGIEKNQIQDALEIAKKYRGNINGLHIYVGTNYQRHEDMLPALTEFFSIASLIPALDYINIGGGIGVDYLSKGNEFNIQEYGLSIKTLIDKLRLEFKRNIRLIFEPGRRLAASSGWFATRITDIKYLNNIRYVVVDASISVFPRPFHHPDSPHKTITPFKNGELGFEDSIVVGKTTFSRDILSRTSLSKNLVVGDVILFDQAGAYCDSMRSRFLGQQEPNNIFLE